MVRADSLGDIKGVDTVGTGAAHDLERDHNGGGHSGVLLVGEDAYGVWSA